MIDQIKHIKSFMSADDAKRITDYAKAHPEEFLDYGNKEQEFKVNAFRSGTPEALEIREIATRNALRVYDFVKSNYDGEFAEFQDGKSHIARFEEGFGMHEHFDSSRPNEIATLIYVNDDYEGGEIYFPEYDVFIKPEAGDLVCFPDNPYFIHGVKPIISGTRFTTPRWFTRIV